MDGKKLSSLAEEDRKKIDAGQEAINQVRKSFDLPPVSGGDILVKKVLFGTPEDY